MGLPSGLASSASMSNKSTPVWAWHNVFRAELPSSFVPGHSACTLVGLEGPVAHTLPGDNILAWSTEHRRCTACVRVRVTILVRRCTRKERPALWSYTCLCPKRQSCYCSGPVERSWGRTDHSGLLVAAHPRPSGFKFRRLSVTQVRTPLSTSFLESACEVLAGLDCNMAPEAPLCLQSASLATI